MISLNIGTVTIPIEDVFEMHPSGRKSIRLSRTGFNRLYRDYNPLIKQYGYRNMVEIDGYEIWCYC